MLVILCVAGTAPPLDDRAAWREACALSGYSCFGLSPPAVIEAPMGLLNGRYKMGDRHILLDEGLPAKLAYAVKVHEMTHYLQYKRKAWKYTKANACQMEKDAFDVSNKVLRRLGETRGVVDWNVARVVYGCA